MSFFYKSKDGQVYQFETEEDADIYGPEGLLRMTEEETEAHLNPPPPPPVAWSVDVERDRRISSGFDHDGKLYQSRPEDRASITENANLAAMAIMNGAQPGELNWLNDDEEFQWIDADNERVPMDAQSMINLARSAATHKNRLVFAGRTLKDMSPIPADFADDKYWS